MTVATARRVLAVMGLALCAGLGAGLPLSSMAQTVLITGANSGIGLEFTKQYAARGWTVIATHRRSDVPRSLARVMAEFDTVQVETMDVTDLEQIRALAEKLADVPIDLLINNAGVYNDRGVCAPNEERCPGDWSTQTFGNLRHGLFDTIMTVNVKGPLMVSEAFYEHVKASTHRKIVSISSTNGSLTEQLGGSGAIYYRASKAALNRAMQLVASASRRDGVTVVLLHPGAVLTERQAHLVEFEGMVEMPFSVERMIETIDGFTLSDSGSFVHYDGTPAPW
jgi:NAD(P)-dependent dehydrogenase (short-subunit alcohol dehydrogenase family)